MAVSTQFALCPLSGEIMIDPVCVNGKDYEKDAIVKYSMDNENKDPDGNPIHEIKESSQMVKSIC